MNIWLCLNWTQRGEKKQLNLQVSQGSHCHFLHILHLILSTALILSTPLRNSCANEAACGSRGKERKAGRISAKTYEINNTVQPGVLSQQVDTRTLICSHKISTKSGFAALWSHFHFQKSSCAPNFPRRAMANELDYHKFSNQIYTAREMQVKWVLYLHFLCGTLSTSSSADGRSQ